MKKELYSAILKSVSGRFSVYIVQFLFLAIYARIFSPEEFGIIASIQVFVLFFQMLADVGIGPAIINDEKLEKEHINGIFTFTLCVGISLSILFFFFSSFLGDFYNRDYNYTNISIIISLSVFFNALNIVPLTTLNKDANFILIAKNDILSEVISFICVFFLYTKGLGVLALASRFLFLSIFKFVFSYISSTNTSLGRPYFNYHINHINKIIKFASYQFGFNFINYFSRNLDNILVGKYLGFVSLGIYDKSYQLMRYPLMITTFAMNPAIQPIMTKYRGDHKLIAREHNVLAKRLFFIALLISSFMYLNAEDIVKILFGDKWVEVIPLIKIFSLMIPLQAVLSTSGSFFLVMNKPKLLFFSGVISSFSNITCICIGVYLGNLQLIATSLLMALVFNFAQCYYIMFSYCLKESFISFLYDLSKSIAVVFFPVMIYYFFKINVNISTYYNLWVSFAVNIIVSIFCLSLFFVPIKKLFNNN